MSNSPPQIHERPGEFQAALLYTSAETGFNARLIEKDFYCSLILQALHPLFENSLVFKGGTSLNKVHAGFYRLSEDLDFALPAPLDVSRRIRREIAAPVREIIAELCQGLAGIRISAGFQGHDDNRQHSATFAYRSCLTSDEGSVKIEISVREPLVQQRCREVAKTLLVNPNTGKQFLEPIPVTVMTRRETYAEKMRAALTRVAVRDHYDLNYAIRMGILDIQEPAFLELVKQKLAAHARSKPGIDSACVANLRLQVDAELRPVLRSADFAEFNLDQAIELVETVLAKF